MVNPIEKQSDRLQTGALVDRQLWRRFKAQAALEGRSASMLLDEAMRNYLDRAAKDAAKGEGPKR